MLFPVKIFATGRSSSPVIDFFKTLDVSTHAKTIRTIELLETHGNHLPPPYSKKITRDLYELRTSGKISVRILYAHINGTFYLLHAFKKQTQKTPHRDIQTALDRKPRII